VVSAFLPIWILTAIGYVVGRTGVLGAAATDVLGRFVFLVAMPAALFGTLSRAPLAQFGGVGLLAFATSTFVVGGVAFAIARWRLRRTLGEQAIAGMASGYINAANLGIPVAVRILGDASFLAVVLLFQVLILAPLVLSALDLDARVRAGSAARQAVAGGPAEAGGRPAAAGPTVAGGTEAAAAMGRARRWGRLISLPMRNPILLACAAGVLVHSAGWTVPGLLRGAIELLGAAAVPTALIALGLSLYRPPALADEPDLPGRGAELLLIVVLKIVAQPLLAYGIAHFVLGLNGPQLLAVVICAALPTAQNTFLFARAYGVDSRLARDSVVASTALSMITLTVAAALLT
jgi:predicted permease